MKAEMPAFPLFLPTHFHSAVIHNSQKVEPSKCPSADRQMERQNTVHIYSGLSLSFKKEGTHVVLNLEDVMLSESCLGNHKKTNPV